MSDPSARGWCRWPAPPGGRERRLEGVPPPFAAPAAARGATQGAGDALTASGSPAGDQQPGLLEHSVCADEGRRVGPEAMVGDDRHSGAVAQQGARLAHHLVDRAVHLEQRLAQRVPRLVEVLPQPVLGEVGALEHRHHDLVLVLAQPPHHDLALALDQLAAAFGELLVRQLADAVGEVQQRRQLPGKFRRLGVIAVVARQREARHHAAFDRPGGIGHRHRQHRHPALDAIPERRPRPAAGGDEVAPVLERGRVARPPQPAVALDAKRAEVVHAVTAGVPAGHHRRPRGRRDRRHRGAKRRRGAFFADRRNVRQFCVSLPDDGVRAAVEPDHEQPGHEPAGTSIALCTRSATDVRCSPAAGTEDISPAWS